MAWFKLQKSNDQSIRHRSIFMRFDRYMYSFASFLIWMINLLIGGWVMIIRNHLNLSLGNEAEQWIVSRII